MNIFQKIFLKSIRVLYRCFIQLNKKELYSQLNISNLKPSIEYPWHIEGKEFVVIGNNFISRYNLRIEAIESYGNVKNKPIITIGNNVCFNTDVHIGCINKIQIGDNCLIGSKVLITDHDHGKFDKQNLELSPAARNLYSKGGVVIGANVWIGELVSILSGVNIGANSIIAANSVVTQDIPSNSVAAGNPARVIKT